MLDDADEVLTVNEVAERLKIHIKTVYALAGKGQLPGFKVGPKSWRFKKAEIDKLINGKSAE